MSFCRNTLSFTKNLWVFFEKIMDFYQRIFELWAKIPSFGWKNPWKWTFYYYIKILNVMSDQKFPVNWVFRRFSWVFWEFFAWVYILLEFFSLEFFFPNAKRQAWLNNEHYPFYLPLKKPEQSKSSPKDLLFVKNKYVVAKYVVTWFVPS